MGLKSKDLLGMKQLTPEEIMEILDHGVTMLQGKGMYTGADRPVLMSVIPNNEIITLKHLVHDVDEKAFMIVQNANQVLGEGFTPISKAINMQFGN